ncbi:methyl-accepting chemotaxis protein [Thiospirochaeta perfilievii]|uniref:Methyl-accepting chemotaxis protein n=1 Tax=Thiospirochaeta perfilievii TaxID=252967 RepID=A0A5C1Q971_9SPIO|nr:methyl-accepting chemotaxis protein [Thiospirochaeta perfilievii]QEN03459.1 methyl-accepting chemotaxis protein [Thiospirochaeta perfilievii]
MYIKPRLILSFTLTITLLFSLAGGIILAIVSNSIRLMIQSESQNMVTTLTNVVETMDMDKDFEKISKVVLDRVIGETGFYFVLDKHGTYIIHPNKSVLGQNWLGKEDFIDYIIEQRNSNLEKRFIRYISPKTGKWKQVYFQASPKFGWSICSSAWEHEIYNPIKSIITWIIIILVIGISISIVISIVLGVQITKPLRKIVNLLPAMSSGDLSQEIVISSKDEIGDMVIYLNRTFDKIRKLIAIVKNQSISLQNVALNLSNNMSETAIKINDINNSINRIDMLTTNQVLSVTGTSEAIDKITISIETLNYLIEDQSTNVTESSASIEEMIANISSVTQTLIKNDINIKKLKESSNSGRNGLDNIASDILKVAEESDGLLEISLVIQNIASQTNLLSMNAAIEAAHAGDTGKGFAVVADEIRKLAENSNEKAKTVSVVLKRIKDSIEEITNSTKNVQDKFDIIQSEVDIVAEQEIGIRRAMEEQSSGSTQVLEAISTLNDITQQVQVNSQEMLRSSEQVSKEVFNMNSITEKITTGISEITTGEDLVSIAVTKVNELTNDNKSSIEALMKEVGKFKVD